MQAILFKRFQKIINQRQQCEAKKLKKAINKTKHQAANPLNINNFSKPQFSIPQYSGIPC
jgi:hypothetical protein